MILPRCSHAAWRRWAIRQSWLLLAVVLLCSVFPVSPAAAEHQIVTGTGAYRLGDRETKEDGIRFATEQAKRHALDQVAFYLESITVARDLDITQEEIRSYTAGVVLVLDQQVSLSLDGQIVVVHVDLTAQIDTDEVLLALAAVKQHEEARAELLALQKERDRLHQELDAANRALAAARTSEQQRTSSRQRDDLLNRAQSNAMVAQAWTDWLVLISPTLFPSAPGRGGMPQVQALIAAAARLNPNNPHLGAVQQALARQPPAPREPPAPPVPHTVPVLPRMPTYQVVPRREHPAESEERASQDKAAGPPTLYTWPQIPAPPSQDGQRRIQPGLKPGSASSGPLVKGLP